MPKFSGLSFQPAGQFDFRHAFPDQVGQPAGDFGGQVGRLPDAGDFKFGFDRPQVSDGGGNVHASRPGENPAIGFIQSSREHVEFCLGSGR